MERKIMSLGRSSLVISLPKHWIDLNELKKGDTVSLAIQRDRSLVVSPGAERKKEPKMATLQIEQNERETLITRRVISCYLNGYSSIKIVSRNIFSVAQRKAIRNIVRMLYMRIMESDAKSMLIQTLIDESKASLELAIHRMHMIAYTMGQDVLNALRNRDIMLAKAVFSLDDDVDHFCFFLIRLVRNAAQDSTLANQLGVEPLDCIEHQILIYRVEHAADHAATIAKHIILLNENIKKIPDDLLTLIFAAGTEAINLYNRAVNAFFSKDIAASDEILEQQKNIEKLDREITSKTFMSEEKDPMIICAICSLRDSIKRIAECSVDIAETTIDRAYRFIT